MISNMFRVVRADPVFGEVVLFASTDRARTYLAARRYAADPHVQVKDPEPSSDYLKFLARRDGRVT